MLHCLSFKHFNLAFVNLQTINFEMFFDKDSSDPAALSQDSVPPAKGRGNVRNGPFASAVCTSPKVCFSRSSGSEMERKCAALASTHPALRVAPELCKHKQSINQSTEQAINQSI